MSASLSKSKWDHWCHEFGESHQTNIGFCRDNNLNYHQFLYWFKKYNKTSAKLIPVKSKRLNYILGTLTNVLLNRIRLSLNACKTMV